jgi:hypothetical protein
MSIKSQVDNVLIDASPRKPKPGRPLPGGASLTDDLNIGPVHKQLLSGDYNHIIHSHNGKGPFISPSEAGAFNTVDDAVTAVQQRI